MTTPATIDLRNIDPDDIGDVLKKVEKSFGFEFSQAELKDVRTFGELCDIIVGKVQGNTTGGCTTQQAFYKLRDAIGATCSIRKEDVTIDTPLHALFPRQKRHQQIKAMEQLLGFSTKVLRPKHWVTMSLGLLLFASIAGLFVNWQTGFTGLALSLSGLFLSNKLGKELDLTTVGQLAERIAREHYMQARRNPATVNPKEVEVKVKELFMSDLALEEEALAREARFV